MSSYATEADVLGTFRGQAVPSGADLARLTALLPVATEQLNRHAKQDWFRHPADADPEPDPEAWYADGSGTGVLHVHTGIVSLTTVEVRYSLALPWTEVPDTGYVLRGTDPDSDAPDPDGMPYFHVVLNGSFHVHSWPRGTQQVRLTGVRGWPAIPSDLVEATVERARQLYAADSSWSGAQVVTDGFGSPRPMPGLPESFFRFLTAEAGRFHCHV